MNMFSQSLNTSSPRLSPSPPSREFDLSQRSFRSVSDFQKAKNEGRKISMLSVYDAIYSRLAVDAGAHTLLVGDSVAMALYGFESTIHATVEMIATHVAAVRRTCPSIFLVADLPFGSYRKGVKAAMKAVESLARAGASAVKLEGVAGNEKIITHIVESGIPVMGHLGLTPQHALALGGYKAQGKTEEGANRISEDASKLEDLGAFSLVLECVSQRLGARASSQLSIPVIGIGAGAQVDGQVLVAYDLLGLSLGRSPRFVRKYLEGKTLVLNAFEEFFRQVDRAEYPSESESYS
ncbi:MAG TPA: 3-methyl-2-oxobutanoate hydroxymethyltransferase [Blastocatellia bacterium]|nr:3-methyl-2-oxobutanoate hydroxymethyltransferase [Blastocatellia bacterium]